MEKEPAIYILPLVMMRLHCKTFQYHFETEFAHYQGRTNPARAFRKKQQLEDLNALVALQNELWIADLQQGSMLGLQILSSGKHLHVIVHVEGDVPSSQYKVEAGLQSLSFQFHFYGLRFLLSSSS